MFVPFTFTAGSRDGGSRAVVGSTTFNTSKDVIALSFSDDGEVSAPVVFAGYGIVVPETQNFGYDSYATLDVKDKKGRTPIDMAMGVGGRGRAGGPPPVYERTAALLKRLASERPNAQP